MTSKFEKGDLWYSQFRGDMGILMENVRRVVVTANQMRDLFANPVTLVQPPTGYFVGHGMTTFYKPVDAAGGTYTVGAATNLDVGYSNGTASLRISAATLPINLLNTAAEIGAYYAVPMVGASGVNSAQVPPPLQSLPLQLRVTGGNLAGTTTSPFIIVVSFRFIPIPLPAF